MREALQAIKNDIEANKGNRMIGFLLSQEELYGIVKDVNDGLVTLEGDDGIDRRAPLFAITSYYFAEKES